MKGIPANSVDMVLCDLPYQMTDCEWDKMLPFAELWEHYNRIVKEDGAIVLFAVQPFTTKLIYSNLKQFRYCWYWKKNNKTGAPFAKVQPLRCIEDICVFCVPKGNAGKHKELRQYFFDELQASGLKRRDIDELLQNSMSSHYFTNGAQFAIPNERDYKKMQSTGYFQKPYEEIKKEYAAERGKLPFKYNPQGIRKLECVKVNKPKGNGIYRKKQNASIQTHTGYPVHLLEFKNDTMNKNRLHPTQKPVALLEYLIKTYTNPGEIVLDNCMGSGSTGEAAINTDRRFIGIEKDEHFFTIAEERIKGVLENANPKTGAILQKQRNQEAVTTSRIY